VGYNTYKQKYTKYSESFCIRDTGKYVARFSSNGGQRIVTVLIYLNDVVQGGQTSFPQLGLNMQPKQGRPLNDIIITLNDIIRRIFSLLEVIRDCSLVVQVRSRTHLRITQIIFTNDVEAAFNL